MYYGMRLFCTNWRDTSTQVTCFSIHISFFVTPTPVRRYEYAHQSLFTWCS